jgi:hypothetical protein
VQVQVQVQMYAQIQVQVLVGAPRSPRFFIVAHTNEKRCFSTHTQSDSDAELVTAMPSL